jgi:hypothetical protein
VLQGQSIHINLAYCGVVVVGALLCSSLSLGACPLQHIVSWSYLHYRLLRSGCGENDEVWQPSFHFAASYFVRKASLQAEPPTTKPLLRPPFLLSHTCLPSHTTLLAHTPSSRPAFGFSSLSTCGFDWPTSINTDVYSSYHPLPLLIFRHPTAFNNNKPSATIPSYTVSIVRFHSEEYPTWPS